MANEYIRLSTLELCADEIIRKGIPGSLAELGVYQGHFASNINALFPDRTLYLFDTFNGFNTGQLEADCEKCGLNYDRDFSDTSSAVVLSKMPWPGRCIIRKGLFP